MKVITATFYNRPDCTKLMLRYLSRCDHIQEYTLVCSLEPGFPEVEAELEAYQCPKEIHTNDRLLGCWANKKQVISRGFELADFVIHMEDDLLIAKDGLKYMDWARRTYQDNPNIFTVSPFNHLSKADYYNIVCNKCQDPLLQHLVLQRVKYTSIGWATWKDRWLEYEKKWTGRDHELEREFRKGRREVFPVVSRINHIGCNSGIRSHVSLRESVCDFLGRQDVIKNDLLVNKYGREWIKLDDENVRTRESKDLTSSIPQSVPARLANTSMVATGLIAS